MAEAALPPLSSSASRFPSPRRLALLGGGVIVLAAVALIGRWASSPTFVTLYRDLDLKESGEIAEQLAKTNVPFRLVAGGAEVQVPVADVARARVSLAKDGLPASGRPGLELFDKPSWGMTDFTQRVTYQRALEGELSRTLGQIAGVERAEVHLVMPAPSAIRRNDRPAGASVVLTLKGGASLGPETVQGMAYIVSNSVEQLSPDNVAIMDATGRVLSAPIAAGAGGGLTGRQLEAQRGIEQRTVDKIEDLVATVVGVGRVRAQVSAQLSFDQVDQVVESFNPDGQVLQTEQRSEGTAEGAPQTIVSNQYQNSRRTERSQSNAGKLSRLTVSVLVDEKSLRAERTRQLADLEVMVRNAVGIDSLRGDRLSVLAVPFEPLAVQQAEASAKPKVDIVATAERFSRPAVGLVAIVAMILIALPMVRAMAPRPAAGARAAALATAGAGAASGTLPAAEAAEPVPLPGPDEQRVMRLKEKLRQDSNQRPETTAQVVRAWLADKS